MNEITQARARDVGKSEGYWCITITPEAGTQKTCTKREVPLHEHLIEQGFVEFVGTKEGDEPLFALRSTPGKTAPSELVGAHLAKWVRSLGVSDEDVAPNHGWRHRFKTEARGHFTKVEFVDAIQGHVDCPEPARPSLASACALAITLAARGRPVSARAVAPNARSRPLDEQRRIVDSPRGGRTHPPGAAAPARGALNRAGPTPRGDRRGPPSRSSGGGPADPGQPPRRRRCRAFPSRHGTRRQPSRSPS